MPPSFLSGVTSEEESQRPQPGIPSTSQSEAGEVIQVGVRALGLSSCLPVFR